MSSVNITAEAELPSEQANTAFIILVSCIATIGGFLFGFDSGVINGTQKGLESAFNSSSVGTGFNVAVMLLGCAAGAFCAGSLADRFGRKKLLIVSALFFIISAWGSGIAGSAGIFIFYRVLGGIGVGAASVMAPAYISEIAPSEYRGRLTTVQQVAIISGLFIAFLSNYLIAGAAGSSESEFMLGYAAWRWMFWVELMPATLFFVLLLLIPESPRFLVASGKKDEAISTLGRLYGTNAAQQKYQEIDSSLAADHHRPQLKDLIDPTTSKVRRIVWVGIGLAVLQQLVGINVVFYYGAVLWQSVGFSESDSLLINVISGLVSIGACLITIGLIDRIGRKPLLWIGSAGMALTLTIISVTFAMAAINSDGELNLTDAEGLVALVSANLYVFFFNASWGPIMWVMLGEMFSNQIRGSGLAVAGLFQWGANFAITMTFPIFLGSIGLGLTYGFYAAFAFISIFFVLKYVNETKGIELEDMPD
ncbi:sugar porter family MFS transporter [Agarilytica rhodophyticola]|uniref:sugar porter family MFS transporter n=1 Tax=Agarilytica rhodophyticola TaxID=1737490 RepID=UPI000B341128|nr:sugar porter family MFS transporter [Agarilytica rhodophyticola]